LRCAGSTPAGADSFLFLPGVIMPALVAMALTARLEGRAAVSELLYGIIQWRVNFGYFVRIAGVLLVFTYLIVPAVCGINLAQRIGNRLLIGWIVALIGGVAGLFLSYWWDLPSGAAIVCTFGALLILISFIGLWRRRVRLIPGKPDGR
jgi:ABC-type Mn2+/Zn2+ transport system permease subunit